MNKLVLLLAALLLANVGLTAELKVTDLDGQQRLLTGEGRTKPLYLYFFAQWCETYLQATDPEAAARCAEATRAMNALYATHQGEVDFIAVALPLSASEEGVRAFRDRHHIAYPITFDAGGRLAAAYGVMAFPTSVLLDSKGRELARGQGTLALGLLLDQTRHQGSVASLLGPRPRLPRQLPWIL